MSEINIVKPQDSEMCPVGHHIVKGHLCKCESGAKVWVETHKRKNRGKSKKTIYLPENLLYLYWNSAKSYDPLKKFTSSLVIMNSIQLFSSG